MKQSELPYLPCLMAWKVPHCVSVSHKSSSQIR